MAESMAESPESKQESRKGKKSALQRKLTPEQFERMHTFASERLKGIKADLQEFRTKRERYSKVLNNDFTWRKTGDEKSRTIFDLSNDSFNMVKSVHRFMKGRMSEDIFGSEPYFSAVPQGASDLGLSDQIQKYGGYKVRQAELARHGREALDVALANGECAIKTSWFKDVQKYERYASILKESEKGDPVLTDTGEYIYEEDEMVDVMGDNGEVLRKMVTKAPDLILKEGWDFYEELIEEEVTKYNGLDYTIISYLNFYFPINAPDLERSADMIAHQYDSPFLALKQEYRDYVTEDVWNELKVSPPGSKSESTKPKDEVGETQASDGDKDNPPIKVAELYFKYDCLEDGVPRDIYMVLAVDADQVLYCDYLANITPNGVRPIQFITVNRIPGRAYGVGYPECYELAQGTIDKLLNSVLTRNENNANPIKVLNTSAFNETIDRNTVKLPVDRWLTTSKQGVSARDAMWFAEIPDLDDRTQWLIELFIQWIQNDSGVTAAAQGDVGALPSNTTATGTNAILASGSILHLLTLNELKEGFERTIGYSMMLLFWKQDVAETFAYLEGNGQLLMALKDIKALRNLPIDVQLIMTRLKMREQREAAVAAIPIAQGFALLPPFWQERFRSLYVQAFKGFGLENADQTFEPVPAQPGIDPMTGLPIAPPPGTEEMAGAEEIPVGPAQPLNVVAAPAAA